MNDKNIHSNLKENSSDFFSKGEIKWEKSQDEVWAEMELKINAEQKGKSVSMVSKIVRYSAAAVLFALIGLSSLVLFYSKTVESLPGQHVVAKLPDGSEVELNAVSSLKYYPLKWRFERKVKFEGEGFFQVEKGDKFEVVSSEGTTRVLGTSFNIYSREQNYRVTCLTGKVQVTSKLNESVTLLPNSHVVIEKGKLVVKKKFKAEKAVSWKLNQFDFPETPLKEVFDEIERQYAVTIQLQPSLDERNISINFPKKYNVEKVLDFVCKSMNIEFEKESENVFLIKEKS